MAEALPLPFVPATRTPRRLVWGAGMRSRPRRMPMWPRAWMRARASEGTSVRGDLFLVEDALVEARRQAHVRDVAGVQVHAAAHLAARDGAFLAHVGLEEVR